MMTVKTFEFNPFSVNTYVVFDETCECVIIDPGCLNNIEKKELSEYISTNKLHPVRLLNTHAHVDHIVGNKFVAETYNIGLEVHQGSLSFLRSAKGYAVAFGFENVEFVNPTAFIEDGDMIKFGTSELQVIYTPGHAEGSVCFYSEKENFIIVGDVLFNDSIGRTDLPTGNFEILMESIKKKLFVLPAETLVYPGHGPTTSIGFERENNPFII